MKESDSTGRPNSKKVNGRTITNKQLSSKSAKGIMGGNSSKSISNKSSSKTSLSSSRSIRNGGHTRTGNNITAKSGKTTNKDETRKTKKQSQESSRPKRRPKRRASQTYFFKYQLAKNPLKVEERDLKLALLASLQQYKNNRNKTSINYHNSTSSNNNNTTTTTNNNTTDVTTTNTANPSSGANKSKNGKKLLDLEPNPKSATPMQQEPEDSSLTDTQTSSPLPQQNEKYKPETEDFLTFICFRTTAPSYLNRPLVSSDISTNSANNAAKPVPNDPHILNKQCTSLPNKHQSINLQTINSSPTHFDNSNRRPTRQSPRLASSNRKISENDSTSNTAYENSITYEEDVKRASIALEDMAQVAQDLPDCISKSSYKNNKHLVKGLMTKEFAGAFADEETIFESISNHEL